LHMTNQIVIVSISVADREYPYEGSTIKFKIKNGVTIHFFGTRSENETTFRGKVM